MFAHEFFLDVPKFSQDCSLNKNVSKHGDYHSITDLSDFVLEGDCTTNSSPFWFLSVVVPGLYAGDEHYGWILGTSRQSGTFRSRNCHGNRDEPKAIPETSNV